MLVRDFSEYERGWLEAFIDGEGWLGLHKLRQKYRKPTLVPYRKGYSWKVQGGVDNTCRELIERARTIIGSGMSINHKRGTTNSRVIPRIEDKPVFRYYLNSNLLRELLPKIRLVAKERQRLLLIEALSLIARNKKWRTENHDVRIEEIYKEMLTLNSKASRWRDS